MDTSTAIIDRLEDFEDDDIPILSGRGEGIMEEAPATGSGAARRNEDIALDLMKFVAMTTGYGRTTSTGVGFQGTGSAAKPEDYAEKLILSPDPAQAPAIQFGHLLGVVFRLGGRACALKSHASRGGASVAGGHGDKFHEIECDVFIAARRARACGWSLFHDSFSST